MTGMNFVLVLETSILVLFAVMAPQNVDNVILNCCILIYVNLHGNPGSTQRR